MVSFIFATSSSTIVFKFGERQRKIVIFGIEIYWYALIIVAGIVLAYLYCTHECRKQNINPEIITDILIVGLPSSIVGARLYYVVFRWDYYKNNLLEIFNLRGKACFKGYIKSEIENSKVFDYEPDFLIFI